MSIADQAIRDWQSSLGVDAVSTSERVIRDTIENTTSFPLRRVTAVLRPRKASEVERIVAIANAHGARLYPVSTGRNWGLGSKLPTADDCAIVQLSDLNEIREIDTAHHYAIIEPGVSQKQLVAKLDELGLPLQLNVTGSSPASSVVGNLLERGTGFTCHRTEDCRGLEVVLGLGVTLRTGFWDGDAQPAHHYRHGMGPYLDGLFTQSSYGIVTAAVVNLIPKQPRTDLLMFRFPQSKLAEVFDTWAALYRDGLVRDIGHAFNDRRMGAIVEDQPKLEWTAMFSVRGDDALVEFLTNQVKKRLSPICHTVDVVTAPMAQGDDCDPVVRGLYSLHTGRPVTTFMEGMYNSLGERVRVDDLDAMDSSKHGMLACLPLLPMNGAALAAYLEEVDGISRDFGIAPAVTLNPIDDNCAESVVNVYFDRRDPKHVERAHRCNEAFHTRMYARGIRFYRVDIASMRHLVDRPSRYWDTVDALATALDPNGIIAPGHYRRLHEPTKIMEGQKKHE